MRHKEGEAAAGNTEGREPFKDRIEGGRRRDTKEEKEGGGGGGGVGYNRNTMTAHGLGP